MTLYEWRRKQDTLRLIRKNDKKIDIWNRQKYPNANKGVVL